MAVDERDEEIAAGFGEFAYAGIVTVSAPSLEELEKACDNLDDVAASCMMELRPLNGRHDLALSASLPLARALTRKRVA